MLVWVLCCDGVVAFFLLVVRCKMCCNFGCCFMVLCLLEFVSETGT